MNLNSPENVLTNLLRSPPQNGSTQVDLPTMFLQLPKVVEQILHQHGLATPIPRLDDAWYTQILDSGIDAVTLTAITQPSSSPYDAFELVRDCLNKRSAEALALHIYICELLKLCEITVARQTIEQRGRHANQINTTANSRENCSHVTATRVLRVTPS